VVCRDKDANSGWTAASDGTLEERRYYCQNWRSDVVCITDSAGDPQEWIRYSAYGVPFSIPKGDYNCDGVLDSNDTAALTGMVAGSPGFWTDFNQDGNVDTGDTSDLTAYITANSSAPGGRGKLSRGDGTTSSSSLGNRLGYAGYQFDPALAGSVWHVRNRVLFSELGEWNTRDPLPYTDGTNLYSYSLLQPVVFGDPLGLSCKSFVATPYQSSVVGVPVREEIRPGDIDPAIIPTGWRLVTLDVTLQTILNSQTEYKYLDAGLDMTTTATLTVTGSIRISLWRSIDTDHPISSGTWTPPSFSGAPCKLHTYFKVYCDTCPRSRDCAVYWDNNGDGGLQTSCAQPLGKIVITHDPHFNPQSLTPRGCAQGVCASPTSKAEWFWNGAPTVGISAGVSVTLPLSGHAVLSLGLPFDCWKCERVNDPDH
jgi:RHS repeat-associated protein